MDTQHDIEMLLANGFFMTSRNKSPVRSPKKSSFHQKYNPFSNQQSKRNKVCPPRPIVEDELVSLSREASPPQICYDPPFRGTIDQNPIILDAVIKEAKKTAKKTVISRSQQKEFSVKRDSPSKLPHVNFQEPPSESASDNFRGPPSKLTSDNSQIHPSKLPRNNFRESPSKLSYDNVQTYPGELSSSNTSDLTYSTSPRVTFQESPTESSSYNFDDSTPATRSSRAPPTRTAPPTKSSRVIFTESPKELIRDNFHTSPPRSSRNYLRESPSKFRPIDSNSSPSRLSRGKFQDPKSVFTKPLPKPLSKSGLDNLQNEVPAIYPRDRYSREIRSEPHPHKKSRRSKTVQPEKMSPSRKFRPEVRISRCTSPSAASTCRTSSYEYLPSCGSPWENIHEIPQERWDEEDEEKDSLAPTSPLTSNLGSRSYSTSSPDTPDSEYYYDSRNFKTHASRLNDRLTRHVQRSEKTWNGREERNMTVPDDRRSRNLERHTSSHSVRFARNLETDLEAGSTTVDSLASNHSRSPRRQPNSRPTRSIAHSYLDTSVVRPSTPIPRRQDYRSSDDEMSENSDSDEFHFAGNDKYDKTCVNYGGFRNITLTEKDVRHPSSSGAHHRPSPGSRRRRFRIKSQPPSPNSSNPPNIFGSDDFGARSLVSQRPTPFMAQRDFFRSESHNPAPPLLLSSVPPEKITAPRSYSQRFDPHPPSLHPPSLHPPSLHPHPHPIHPPSIHPHLVHPSLIHPPLIHPPLIHPPLIHPPLITYQETSQAMTNRFSEKTANWIRPLKPCPRTMFTKDQGDWFTLPECPDFDVCPSCFESSIAPTEFGRFFVSSPRISPTTEIMCDLGTTSWYRIAWLMLISEPFRRLEMFYDLANIVANMLACENEHNPNRKWYSIIDPWTGTPIQGFEVCLTCVSCLQVLLPELNETFVPIESYSNMPQICSLRHNCKRFVQHFDALEDIAAKSRSEGAPPDVRPFAQLTRHLAITKECQQDTELFDHHWHIINQLPEFTVCEECFTDTVIPLINEGNSIALMFEKTARRIPRASCQLYSLRMTQVFELAAAADDFNALASKARERRTMELRIKAHSADLKRRRDEWGVEEQITRVQKEWRAWE
ncbi:hypothetical protein K3495_g3999 [Podosphaera aphanis]|nr:hypothetical protein K3495_g3999 [Podosphaera aphanis]